MDVEATKLYKPFKKEWMDEPEFQDWLREVVGEPEKFSCIFCQRTYLGSKTEFKKHAKSQKHIKIAEMYQAGISTVEIQREKSMNASDYQKKFRLAWLDEDDFKIWLLPVAGASDKFECSYCDKEYFGGKSEIIKHFKSSKHKLTQQKVNENEKVKEEYIRVVSLRLEEMNELIQTDQYNELQKNGTRTEIENQNRGFSSKYLEMPEFSNWLIACDNEPKKFGCSLCTVEKFGGIKEMRDHMKTQAHMSAQLLQDADNDETPQFLLEIEEESLGLQEHPAVIEMIHDDSNQGFETYETYEDPTIQDDQSQDLEETTRTDNANFLKFYYESAPKTFDVFIISADKTVTYAHRTVLAAACEYFRDIFSSSVHFEIEPVIHIYLPDYTYEVIQLLIQFLYTGEVYLPSNLVEEFSFLCGDLKIRSHNSKSKDEDPILVDIASFVCFNDSQNENEDESQVEFLEEPNQMEEIEDESQPNYEEKFVLYIDNDFNKAVDDISSGENIQLVSLRYNIDQKVLLEHLHNQNKLKRKSEPPDEETRHMNKKPKIQTNNFKTVFQLRAEQNNFKKRLQDAVNSIKCGSSLESAEELFGIPIQVLQRNIKGII